MTAIDLTVPATLRWTYRELPRERAFFSLKDAVRVAMLELKKNEFLSATITTAVDVYEGDQIVELSRRGEIAKRRFAAF